MAETIKERLGQLDRILDDFERPLGISVVGEDEITQEARRLLQLPPDAVRKFSARDCCVAAYVLSQYTHRLQQAINREQCRVTWAENSIRRLIAPRINNYRGYSFEERRLQAIYDDEAAQEYESTRVRSQLRIDRINYLANKTDNMIKSLLSMKNIKGNDTDEST
jgi:hypothetical protein